MHQWQDTKIIDCIAPSGGVTSKVPVRIGSFVVVPSTTAAVGETFAGQADGIFPIGKATGFAPAFGDVAYFDFVTDKVLKSSGFPIGRYVKAAGSSATRACVMLTPDLTASLLASQELQFNLRPANGVATTVVFDWIAPADGEFESIDQRTNARPSSSLGTVVETITNLTGSLNVLTATNVNLESDITNDTTLSLTLSATAANKKFAAGDVIRFAQTTSNADVVAGGGIQHLVKWHRRTAA